MKSRSGVPPDIWLIGSGPMASAYSKVLQAMEIGFEVIGRGTESALNFRKATGIVVSTGGLEKALRAKEAPKVAIVAVGVERLAFVTKRLIEAGTKKISTGKTGRG